MKYYFIILSILFSSASFGFGPIKDGDYIGDISCITKDGVKFKESVSARFSSNQVHWSSTGDSGPLNHTHTLIEKEHGFFSLLDNGDGYTTERGLHFETDVQGIKTEDSYLVSGYDLIHQSSISFRNMKIKCSGNLKRNFIL